MVKLIKLFMVSLISLSAVTGCVSTNVKGYTDNLYKNHKINKISVRVPNASFAFSDYLEKAIVEKLKKNGVSASSFLATFPPTRKWTDTKVGKQLISEGYDTIMYVNMVGSNSSSRNIGYINTGNASIYGNTASFSSASVAINTFSRTTLTRVKLYDVKNTNVIWIGDTNTEAGGLAFMSDETQADSIANEIVTALLSAGHIRTK